MIIIANAYKFVVNMTHSYFINCHNTVGKSLDKHLNTRKLFFLFDTVTPFLGLYPGKKKYLKRGKCQMQKKAHILIIAKTWRQTCNNNDNI